jgi:fluoroacetyl-CoA thioesterase
VPPLEPGLRHSETIMVDERLLVPAMGGFYSSFADMPPVFATAFLVGLVEWTAVNAIRPLLAPGQHTVGTLVDLSHTSATPAGMRATAEVELIAVESRRLRFKVSCRDEAGPIGEGFHERAVIDGGRFMQRLEAKRATARTTA